MTEPAAPIAPGWISIATAARLLSVSPDFVRRECLAGRLPYVQLARRLTRIAIEDVHAYAASRKIAAGGGGARSEAAARRAAWPGRRRR